ncbi:MAG: hypothetical protein MR210_03520 [Erysipelotrichaceae bacterium]|nr:hypothetical protein [Erysipelotrichaceae bacterium]MDY5252389.1 hypothetical protein [Erysipelotrichaceae bacterium]
MNYNNIEQILGGQLPKGIFVEDHAWHNYLNCKRIVYDGIDQKNVDYNMISEANWLLRKDGISCEKFGINVEVGNICFIDFGQAYLNEIGYQHFGLVMSFCQKKALIVPMTSNMIQYQNAYDPLVNPRGKKNLFRLGLIKGMNKPSVLFLNDAKYINTARIIDVKAYIDPHSKLFKEITQRLSAIMFNL